MVCTSSIWEWRIVETAWIMAFTFGAVSVLLMYIEEVVFEQRSMNFPTPLVHFSDSI